MPPADDVRRVFGRFSASGIVFQGGAAAIDTGTIIATFVHGLTGEVRSRLEQRQRSPVPDGCCLN